MKRIITKQINRPLKASDLKKYYTFTSEDIFKYLKLKLVKPLRGPGDPSKLTQINKARQFQ